MPKQKRYPRFKLEFKKFAWGRGGCLWLPIAAIALLILFRLLTPNLPSAESEPWFDTSTETTRTTKTFVNSRSGLDGDRMAHYTDFSFQYPRHWQLDERRPGQPNYVTVTRCATPPAELKDGCALPIELFAVGPFWGPEEIQGTEPQLQNLLRQHTAQKRQTIPAYQKVSAGKIQIGTYSGYEIRYIGKDDRHPVNGQALQFWGRDVFLPDGKGQGVVLMMLVTSASPEVKSLVEVGVKGELPIILHSVKFTSPQPQTGLRFFF
jgi:hypothetical protein